MSLNRLDQPPRQEAPIATAPDRVAPDAAALLDAARRLQPLLAERAPQTEADRRLPDETVQALHATGLFRGVLPRRLGGSGIKLIEQIEIAAALGQGCASTAWVYTLVGDVTAFPVMFLGEEGCEEVYSNPGEVACGVASPSGVAREVDGGYLVSGSWGFASGCLHSDWFAGGVIFEGSPPEDSQGMAFFRLSEAAIKDTWHVAGMCGTGSNTVIADDVFVPTHRMCRLSAHVEREAQFRPDVEPVERWPFAPYFSIGLTGPMLGVTTAALEAVKNSMGKRGVSYFNFEKQTDSGVLLRDLAEAALRIDSAWMHVREGARIMDEETEHDVLPYLRRATVRGHGTFAALELRAAMDALITIGGGSVFANVNPVQRMWRDLNVGSRHAFVNTPATLEAYGRALVDVPNITHYI